MFEGGTHTLTIKLHSVSKVVNLYFSCRLLGKPHHTYILNTWLIWVVSQVGVQIYTMKVTQLG